MFLVPTTHRSPAFARSLDRLFDDAFFAPAAPRARTALDVAESDAAYTITVDLPGYAKDDVAISVDGNTVRVEAKASRDADKKDGERVLYRERSVSNFARSFTLPVEIDEAASTAKLENGVLTLTLNKRQPAPAKRITVN